LARDPAFKSDSIFPGSKYAILIRKPGPVKAHNFLKLNPSCKREKRNTIQSSLKNIQILHINIHKGVMDSQHVNAKLTRQA